MPQKREAAREDAKAILNRLRLLVRALRTFDREAQSRYGLGAAQMFIVHILAHENDLSLNELADRTATDQSSASLAVARLVDEGHVRRITSNEDRRQVRLSLTSKGRALARRAPPATQERILESVETMAPRERAQLTKLLDKLLRGMKAEKGRPGMFFQDETPTKKRAK